MARTTQDLSQEDFWRKIFIFYLVWAILSIGFTFLLGKFKPENLTRLLVLAFGGLQWIFHRPLASLFSNLSPRWRFICYGSFLAAIVEGFHMISKPVFDCLTIELETPIFTALGYFAIDLHFTLPAYLIIFAVMGYFISRYPYHPYQYLLCAGFAQTLGDGGIFYFINAPWMLFFLPFPMTNYHAINFLPFWATQADFSPSHPDSKWAYTIIPVIFITYFLCGTLIQIVGQTWGLTT